jgi:hypothetical protein
MRDFFPWLRSSTHCFLKVFNVFDSRRAEFRLSNVPATTAGVVRPSCACAPESLALDTENLDPTILAAMITTTAADTVRGGAIVEQLTLAKLSDVCDNLVECLGLVDLVLVEERHLESTHYSQRCVVASGVWVVLLVVEPNDFSHQGAEADPIARTQEAWTPASHLRGQILSVKCAHVVRAFRNAEAECLFEHRLVVLRTA